LFKQNKIFFPARTPAPPGHREADVQAEDFVIHPQSGEAVSSAWTSASRCPGGAGVFYEAVQIKKKGYSFFFNAKFDKI
jgi:hypothetical protein